MTYGKPVRIRTAFVADFLLKHFADSFTDAERKELREFHREALSLHISMKQYAPGIYSGIRYFYNNDDMICKNDDYYMYLNMASYRCDGLESGSYGFNMFSNDGATFFARRGNEFYELAGVLEPNFFPGVTARKVEKLEPEANWGGYCSRADFAVGVTDGKKDFAAGFIFEKYNATWKYSEWKRKQRYGSNPLLGGVSAHKSYFKFGHLFMMLGCGITDTEPANGGSLITTIEQCVRKSDFAQLDRDGRWFRNNGFAYGILSGKGMNLNTVRPAAWEKMHRGNRKVEGTVPVFQFWIDHGANAENASYVYLVSAEGVIPEKFPAVLSNTPALQAVRSPDGLSIGAIFYNAGTELETPWGMLSVSAPCGLLIQKEKDSLKITAADARMDRKLNDLTVTLAGKKFVIPLPREPYRGQWSVVSD